MTATTTTEPNGTIPCCLSDDRSDSKTIVLAASIGGAVVLVALCLLVLTVLLCRSYRIRLVCSLFMHAWSYGVYTCSL